MSRVARRPVACVLLGLAALSALAGCAADLSTISASPLTTFGGHRSPLKDQVGAVAGERGAAEADAPARGEKPAKRKSPAERAFDPLRAGSVDDNVNFPAFLTYQAKYDGEPMRPLDVSRRHVLRVVDAAGRSVPSADLRVMAGDKLVYEAKSYADGRQLFHPKVYGLDGGNFTVSATKAGVSGSASFEARHQGDWVVTLDGKPAAPARDVQILFMLDATGSMGGEIEQLQATIRSIATRVAETQGQGAKVSLGLVAYRDRGDDWIVRKKDFTSDLAAFERALGAIEADDGGDYEEDMEAALATATRELSWSEGDAVRLSFLIADAPPHVDYEDSVPYTKSVQKAACLGVKIFGVGCSGLEAEGEYTMRQLAQFTMAKYMFLTRGGDSDRGGGPVSHTVDSYDEGRLDDMIVATVRGELAALGE